MAYDDDLSPISGALDAGFGPQARGLARELALRCDGPRMLQLAEVFTSRGLNDVLADIWHHRQLKRGLDPVEVEPFAQAMNACAVSHMREGRFDHAHGLLAAVKEVAPQLPYIRRNLASIALERGEFGGAIDEIDAALTLRPNDPALLEMRGRILYQSGDAERSTEYFQQAVDGGRADAGLWLIKALCVDARIDEAIEEIEALLVRHPDRGRALLQLELGEAASPLGMLFHEERAKELIREIQGT